MAIYLHQNDIPSNIIHKFTNQKELAIDTETMGLNITRDRLCLIQISAGDGDAHLVRFAPSSNYDSPNLIAILANPEICKIFHFARFDLAAIKYYLKTEVQNIYCTKIASKLVRTYTDSHGLKTLCEEIANIEISKKQQSSDWGNDNLSNKQLEYAANDVLYLHIIKEKLEQMLLREHKKFLYDKIIDFLPVRVDLDLASFTIDIFSH
jgi:ribonuclease D